MESGHFEEVVALCTEEIETPDTKLLPEALLLRATFYVLSGQGQNGLSDLEQLLKLDGISPGVSVFVCVCVCACI